MISGDCSYSFRISGEYWVNLCRSVDGVRIYARLTDSSRSSGDLVLLEDYTCPDTEAPDNCYYNTCHRSFSKTVVLKNCDLSSSSSRRLAVVEIFVAIVDSGVEELRPTSEWEAYYNVDGSCSCASCTGIKITSPSPAIVDVPVTGGNEHITVSAPAGCNWSGESHDDFLGIQESPMTGDGSIQYTVDNNTGGVYREGTASVAGQTFIVRQAGDCAGPVLEVSNHSLDFGSSRSSRTFDVWNDGCETLHFTVSVDKDWVDVNPVSESNTGEQDPIRVTVSRSNMTPKTYTAVVTVDSTSGGTETVNVSMTVSDDPDPNPSEGSFSLDIVDSVGGSIEVDPASEGGEYPAGTEIRLEAVAEEGWHFSEWTGYLSSLAPDRSVRFVEINQDITIGAVFGEGLPSLSIESITVRDSIWDGVLCDREDGGTAKLSWTITGASESCQYWLEWRYKLQGLAGFTPNLNEYGFSTGCQMENRRVYDSLEIGNLPDGEYVFELLVSDSYLNNDTESLTFGINCGACFGGDEPSAPGEPFPADDAVEVDVNPSFSWSAHPGEGRGPLTYTLILAKA